MVSADKTCNGIFTLRLTSGDHLFKPCFFNISHSVCVSVPDVLECDGQLFSNNQSVINFYTLSFVSVFAGKIKKAMTGNVFVGVKKSVFIVILMV